MAEPSESRDGAGAGDHDAKYEFGHPRDCLTSWTLAHLLILRGHVKDRTGAIVGDANHEEPKPAGLYVPISDHWKE